MVFGPQRLSYSSADAIARRITSKVTHTVKDKSVVIANTPLLADFANLQAVYLNFENLQRDYDGVFSYASRMNQPRHKRKIKLDGIKILPLASPSAGIGIAEGAAALLSAVNPFSPGHLGAWWRDRSGEFVPPGRRISWRCHHRGRTRLRARAGRSRQNGGGR
jgi:hypothetical protein